MLNQDDERRLAAIERQLQASDPDLAHLLMRWPTPPKTRWARFTAIITIVTGTLGMLLSMLALAPVLLLLSAAVACAGWTWLYRLGRHIDRRAGTC